MQHQEQLQRVVSPSSNTPLTHYQAQYDYEAYGHRTDSTEVVQHDPRHAQQV